MIQTYSPMSIRRARAIDAEAVAEIYNQAITGRCATFDTALRTPDDRRCAIETMSDRYPILVADDNSVVRGWASLSEHSPRACFRGIADSSVYVADGQQGRGVGTALIRGLIDEAERLGFWKIVSRIFLFNRASRAMSRRAGFREVGVLHRHAQLDGEWLDVVFVERLIDANQR